MIEPKDEETRYGCAPVTLFQLHDDGRLHPLGIVVDYLGTMQDSVCFFNDRTSPSDPKRGESWPWRYAKTCAQVADWSLHEVVVHLTNTHLIEESTIVATHRNIPEDNIIFQLLEPHWYKTLSLNAAARETLVPKVVLALTGYDATSLIKPSEALTLLGSMCRMTFETEDFLSRNSTLRSFAIMPTVAI